jgi:hypothetical protein
MTKNHCFLVSLAALAACGEERPPAPTAEQAAQLNEAEELLDQEAGKEKGPESNLPGPSD